jgi:hypothetical protein
MSENERNLMKGFETAAQEVFDELMAMDDASFIRFIDEHKDGDIANLLLRASAWTPASGENYIVEAQSATIVARNVFVSANSSRSESLSAWWTQPSPSISSEADRPYSQFYQGSLSTVVNASIEYASGYSATVQVPMAQALAGCMYVQTGGVQGDYICRQEGVSVSVTLEEGSYVPQGEDREDDLWEIAA